MKRARFSEEQIIAILKMGFFRPATYNIVSCNVRNRRVVASENKLRHPKETGCWPRNELVRDHKFENKTIMKMMLTR